MRLIKRENMNIIDELQDKQENLRAHAKMIVKLTGPDGEPMLSLESMKNSDMVYNNKFKPLELCPSKIPEFVGNQMEFVFERRHFDTIKLVQLSKYRKLDEANLVPKEKEDTFSKICFWCFERFNNPNDRQLCLFCMQYHCPSCMS